MIKSRPPTSSTRRQENESSQQPGFEPQLASFHSEIGPVFEHSKSTGVTLDSSLNVFNPDFADLGQCFDQGPELGELWDLQAIDDSSQYQFSDLSSLSYTSTPSEIHMAGLEQGPHSFNALTQPISSTHLRAFDKRTGLNASTQKTAKLIFHTLQSYPLMMLRDKALPPFIHPQSLSIGIESDEMELLTNCISLVHMLGDNVKGNQKLFWRNVRTECGRICANVS